MPVEMEMALRKITVDQIPQLILLAGTAAMLIDNLTQLSGDIPFLGFGLAPRLISPINALSGSMLMVLQSWPSSETVLATMGVLTRSDRALESSNLVHLAPTIEARNVVFSYSDDSGKVFDGISFRIPAGLRTGLVAKLGQGKTTFFKLALRFYDPSSGELLLGGKPTTAYSATDLREKIAMLSQFPAFFHDTLRENLRMAMPGASDAEIEAVCRQTGIWEVLSKKKPPVSLDANIGAAQYGDQVNATVAVTNKLLLLICRDSLTAPFQCFCTRRFVSLPLMRERVSRE